MKHLHKKVFNISVLILLFTISAAGQLNNHLILKKGPKSIEHFIVGDSIRLMKNNFKSITSDRIQAIGEDFIIIKSEQVMLKEISAIIKVRALHFRAAGANLKIAGPSLIFIDGFNSLIRNFHPLFSRNIAIAGASIFVSGFLLPLLQTKVYDLNKAYYLRIVPADPETFRNLR